MKNLWWIIRELLPFWPKVCLALLLSTLTITSHIGLMATSSYLLARAALQPPIMDLMVTIVGVRFFGIARAVFRYCERLVSHDVTFRVLSRLRVIVYKGIEPLAPAHLKDWRSGDLLSRIVGDVEVQQNLFLRIIAPPLVAVLVLLGYGFFLGRFNQGFAYILAGFFLMAGVMLPFLVRVLERGIGKMKIQAKAKLHTSVLDSLQGMPEMLAFGGSGKVFGRIEEAQNELSKAERRNARVIGVTNGLMGVFSNLGMLAVVVLGILLVEQKELEGILLGMLVLGVLSSFEAVAPLPIAMQHLEENQIAGRRLKNLMDEGEKVLKADGYVQDARSNIKKFDLVFNDVSFRYKQDEPWVLKDVSFRITQGQHVGIIGQSGAGKSSLVNLLVKFWEPDLGEILLGGESIKERTPQEIRESIAVVSQRTHLFHATVKENLLLAKPEATDAEIYEAARKAKIHDFILSLPQGYDSFIGEEGMKLSGGQQQRLAIARVLLMDAPILILDEATNGLDPLIERELMEELLILMEGRTVFMVTHNLELIKDMDQILVFSKGKIVENQGYGRNKKGIFEIK